MNDVRAVVVPKELYYHEVAYVRGLEAEIARLRNGIDQIRQGDFERVYEMRQALRDLNLTAFNPDTGETP